MLMVGGTSRLSRRLSFVSENWLFPNFDNPIASAGIRTVGDNVSLDFGFFTVLGSGAGFIPIPWIGVAWKF